jgi:hypothetical protein
VQYSDYQRTLDDQWVTLAAFHLESEANQWWQQMMKVYREEQLVITWEMFEKELILKTGLEDHDANMEDLGDELHKLNNERTFISLYSMAGVHRTSDHACVSNSVQTRIA